eukprot:CAMPEP_0117029654 /NCGR_PEP_ID=MMETSP0472-20121206/21455_1 /TAXON_ID=693140 ORGANISM="Tiarina fusus, Strain LIS" /NCGR_SAMPLE_ID=MMETSP0472 /ASSEMBLY_ACC=CAM_ASM_000603 /LENGTH=419 /DNA_ID=CAMNT_0004737481 /DNA_START=291 /DNA_END=1547 /DNA_ORIENTATION=-
MIAAGRYYLNIEAADNELGDIVSAQRENFVLYSLQVSWDVCGEGSWGSDCSVVGQQVEQNGEMIVKIPEGSMKIIYFETNGDSEVELLVSGVSTKICVWYQYGIPFISKENENLGEFCGEQTLSHIIQSGSSGLHFFTFFAEEFDLEFSVLLHRTEISMVPFDFNLAIGEEPASVPANSPKTIFSFEVPSTIKNLEIEIAAETICDVSCIIVPSSQRNIDAAKIFSKMTTNSHQINLISPIPSSWLLIIDTKSPCNRDLSVSIQEKIPQALETISGNFEGIKSFLPNSQNFFQLQPPQQGRYSAVVEISAKDVILVAKNFEIPSETNFEIFSNSGEITLPVFYGSVWNIGVFFVGDDDISDVKMKASYSRVQKNVENTQAIQGGDSTNGADTRVSIFIWTTIAVCGGILLLCAVALVIW